MIVFSAPQHVYKLRFLIIEGTLPEIRIIQHYKISVETNSPRFRSVIL